MKIGKALSLSYRYRFSHLFKKSRAYENIKNELGLEDGTFSSFLYALKRKEGHRAFLIASISSTIVIVVLSALLDIFLPLGNMTGMYRFASIILYTLFLSLKFDFISFYSFREMGEAVFTLLSLYFTHYYSLTLLLVLLFENAEALTLGGND